MHAFIQETRDRVRDALDAYVRTDGGEYLTFEPWSGDLRPRLAAYALRGKLMRGAMVGFGYRLFQPTGDLPEACVDGGVAMELPPVVPAHSRRHHGPRPCQTWWAGYSRTVRRRRAERR